MPACSCAACGMAFEEEGALEMGASKLETPAGAVWFCCPPCEMEWRTKNAG